MYPVEFGLPWKKGERHLSLPLTVVGPLLQPTRAQLQLLSQRVWGPCYGTSLSSLSFCSGLFLAGQTFPLQPCPVQSVQRSGPCHGQPLPSSHSTDDGQGAARTGWHPSCRGDEGWRGRASPWLLLAKRNCGTGDGGAVPGEMTPRTGDAVGNMANKS